jgi:hypothetical protein
VLVCPAGLFVVRMGVSLFFFFVFFVVVDVDWN